ncbi:MAG: hypothetical protein WB992_25130 [Bryobacteraceae bacterium]
MYEHSASASAEDTKRDYAVPATPSDDLLGRMIHRHGDSTGAGFAQLLRHALGYDRLHMRAFLTLDREHPMPPAADPAEHYSGLVERILRDSKLAERSQRVRDGGGSMRDARRLARRTFENFIEDAGRNSLRLFIFLLEGARQNGFTEYKLSGWAKDFTLSERENRRRLLNRPHGELWDRLEERHGYNKGRRIEQTILGTITSRLELTRFLLLEHADPEIAEDTQDTAAHYDRLLAQCRETHSVRTESPCSDVVH